MKRLAAHLLLTPAFMVMLVFTAWAADQIYDHNGSTMRLQQSGATVNIYYLKPRAALTRNGVKPGTLLFSGKLSNGYLEGMSRIFNANCGEVDYFVYGDFRPGNNFKLNGAAPVLSGMSCRIVDNVHDGPNANLVFRYVGRGG